MLGTVLGLPGYAAIAIAFGFTGLGVFIDLNRINGQGTIFKGCYFAGCVLAVCWVKRRALFGPMVQPPLLLAIAVPAVVLLSGNSSSGGSSGGLLSRVVPIGGTLLNSFPTMAMATAFVLAIGIARYVLQRPVPVPTPPARPLPNDPRQDSGTPERTRPPTQPRERVRPTGHQETRSRPHAATPPPDVALTEQLDRPAELREAPPRPQRRAPSDRPRSRLAGNERPGSGDRPS
jgi:hypothetical protein